MGRKRRETPEECTRNAQGLPLAWGGYIIRPTDQKYPSIRHIPDCSGIYGWYTRDGDLMYVGRSRRMRSRLRDHHMPSFGGSMLSYRLVPEQYLAGVEMAHIKTLEPYHNDAREAAGLPFWDAMCGAIDAAWQDVWPVMYERVYATERAIVRKVAEQIAARL
jgi:hypothetical protein